MSETHGITKNRNPIIFQEWLLENTNCGGSVILTISTMDIEEHSTGACIYDFLEVAYGSYTWRYCGKRENLQLRSDGKSMRIKFHTDNLGTANGFVARWEVEKGKLFI